MAATVPVICPAGSEPLRLAAELAFGAKRAYGAGISVWRGDIVLNSAAPIGPHLDLQPQRGSVKHRPKVQADTK
jgi:hypothetical protein